MLKISPIKERLVRIGELSQMTGLPVSTLRRLADQRRLPVFRPGSESHRRFPLDSALQAVRAFLTANTRL